MRKPGTVVVLDPKGDRDLFVRAAVEADRYDKPFAMVSTAFFQWSDSFNPLASARTATEIAQRIKVLTPLSRDPFFTGFSMAFVTRIAAAQQRLQIPWTLQGLYNPCVIRAHMESLIDRYLLSLGCPYRPGTLEHRMTDYQSLGLNDHTADALINFARWPREHYQKVTGTLVPTFDGVVGEDIDPLLSPAVPDLTWQRIIDNGMVVYFAFPSLLLGDTANRICRTILQDLIGYLGYRYAYEDPREMSSITVVVDEAGDVVYPEFIDAVNKGRGGNVRFILAMQSRADADAKLGEEHARRVFDNLNTRVYFRLADEKTAEVAMRSVTGTIEVPETPTVGIGMGGVGGLTGHTGMRLKASKDPLIPPSFLTALPIGEFFARKGGVWWKGRAPLLTPVSEATLEALGIAAMWRAMDPNNIHEGDVCDPLPVPTVPPARWLQPPVLPQLSSPDVPLLAARLTRKPSSRWRRIRQPFMTWWQNLAHPHGKP